MINIIVIAVFVSIVVVLLLALPMITIDTGAIVASSAWSWIRAALYFIPTHTVLLILQIIVALGVFRLIIALVKTIWGMLPIK